MKTHVIILHSKVLKLILLLLISCTVSCNKENIKIKTFNQKEELQNYFVELEKVKVLISNKSPDIIHNSSIIFQVLNEQEAEKMFEPLKIQTINLLKSYNLYFGIEKEFDYDVKKLIVAGMIIFEKEKWLLNNDIELKLTSEREKQIMRELKFDELTHCLLDAFGLGAGFTAIYMAATKMSIKGLATLAISVLGRTVGWVGLAYTAYQFTSCLIDESND